MLNSQSPDPRASGERRKLYRNRKLKWAPNSLITDGMGNIISRPLTQRLRCFGDPVEWLMGRGDEMRVWGEREPEPNGCAGCPVSAFCATISWERLQSVPQVIDARDRWEAASYHLGYDERYRTPEWKTLVHEINRHEWLDPNEDQLEQEKENRRIANKKKRRKRPASAKRKKVQPRSVPKKIRDKIQAYRDERVNEMLPENRPPDAPLMIRNRTPERLILMGDAWQARELLERERKLSSGRAVFERLQAENKIPIGSPKSIIKRVEEALRRADELVYQEVWPFFDPENETQMRSKRNGLHPNCIFDLSEP